MSIDEVAVELLKPLAAFDQELLNKLLHCADSQSPRQVLSRQSMCGAGLLRSGPDALGAPLRQGAQDREQWLLRRSVWELEWARHSGRSHGTVRCITEAYR
jgi:hypothetical protein